MSRLNNLPNIGAILAEKLQAVGVSDSVKLGELGSKAAFMRIRTYDEGACLSMLYALEGAVQGVRWHSLDQQIKDELKEYYLTMVKE
ncbi:MAG: hypothetical protein K0R55_3210 [Sporomusa sp.]|jgi:DNA transformation protein|nr:hypothetical protein [Sporomusa sp.]